MALLNCHVLFSRVINDFVLFSLNRATWLLMFPKQIGEDALSVVFATLLLLTGQVAISERFAVKLSARNGRLWAASCLLSLSRVK